MLLGRTPNAALPPLPLKALHLPDRLPVAVPSELLHQRPDILAAHSAVRSSADAAGATPLYAVLGARSEYQSAQVTYIEARAARLTDSAALLDAMGNPTTR